MTRTMLAGPPQTRTSLWSWIVFLLASFFYIYTYILRIMPSVMTPQLLTLYHLTAVSLGNLEGSFYLIYMPLQLLVGVLCDRFRPCRLMTLALVACALGTYLFASQGNFYLAILGRLIMGFGSAFAFVSILKFASIWFPENQFAFITGVTVSLGTLGGLFGDLFLIDLIDQEGWRMTVYGIAFVGAGNALLMFFLDRMNLHRSYRPIMNQLANLRQGYRGLFQLMRNRHIRVNCVIGCLLYIPMSGFAETWGIPYLTIVYHLSRTIAASAVSMIFLGWVCGAPFMGLISDAIKTRRLPLTISATVTVILLSIILYVPYLSITTLFILLFIFGLFLSAQVLVFSISRELSPAILTGTAIGTTNMIVMLSGASIFLIGMFLNLTKENHLIHIETYSWNFQLALAVLPLSLLAAVFLTFYLPETYCKPVKSFTPSFDIAIEP